MVPLEPVRFTVTGGGFAERWFGDVFALTGEMGALDAPDLIPSGSVSAQEGLLVPVIGITSVDRPGGAAWAC